MGAGRVVGLLLVLVGGPLNPVGPVSVVVLGEGYSNEDFLQDRAEKLGSGTMNTAKDQRTEARASGLRLKDSGVFRRLHEGRELVAVGGLPTARDTTEQVAKPRVCNVSDLDRALAVLLHNSLRADGLASVDAAAACDRQRQQVDEMRKPDGRVRMSARDLMRICGVSPSMRAAARDLLDQMGARSE